MKTRALTIAPLVAGLLLAFNAAAQDHSQHSMPMSEQDHAKHHEPANQADHSQHQQPAPPMDHAAMGHTMPPATDQPVTPIPVLTDADRVAAQAPPNDHAVHDNGIFRFVQFNRLEAFDADGGNGLEWEGQAWIGRDRNKLWLRSEGERVDGHTESADLEALYGRAVAPWWDLVAGVRHDFKPGASQDFAAIGVMGVAPYKFEVEATAYVGRAARPPRDWRPSTNCCSPIA